MSAEQPREPDWLPREFLNPEDVYGGDFRYFTELGDEDSAIEFLVMSQCFQEAYDMALSRQKIDVYASVIEGSGNGSTQQFVQLAEYFNTLQNHAEAGKFYGLAKDYETV